MSLACVQSAWARVAWGLACLAWTTAGQAADPRPAAPPQTAIDVQIVCAQWDANSAAAFEARVRAELAVRGVKGSLKVHCGSDLEVELRLDGRAPQRARRASRAPKVDDALELLDDLLPTVPAEDPNTPSARAPATGAPTAVNPDPAIGDPKDSEPANSEAPDAAPAQSTTRDPVQQTLDAAANPATALPDQGASTAPKSASASPTQESTPPRLTSTTAPPRPTDSSALRFAAPSAWAAHLNAGAGLWGNTPTLEGTLGGVAALVGAWGLALEGTGVVTLNTPSSYSTQAAGIALGLRYDLTDAWSFEATAGLGVTRVYTDDEQLRLTLGGPGCAEEARGAQCWGLAGKLSSSWTPTTGQLRPRLSLEVAWVQRPIEITQDSDPRDTFSLPRIRPSVLIGVEWRDRTTNRANQASSSE